jgi:hypothetical protein
MKSMIRSTVIAAGAVVLAQAALAQNTSDLMPAAPQPAPGQMMPGYPGQPLPPVQAAPTGTVQKSGDQKGDKPDKAAPTGRYIYDDVPSLGSTEDSELSVAELPQDGIYVVRKGDTLWGISGNFFRSHWAWPKLWAMNPSITNPHWIYPGDLLKLTANAVVQAPVAPSDPVRPPPLHAPQPTGVFLRQTGFVEPGELKAAGTIIGSREEKKLLSTLDEAYVDYKAEQPLEVGQRYTIYRPIKTVRHPVTKKVMGDLVQIYGEAEVKSVTQGRVARVQVVDSLDPIERGFRVGPLRRQFKIVEPVTSARDLSAVVFATLQPTNLVAAETVVFVDRGKKDGVEVGNRFQVVRRGDGVLPIRVVGPIDNPRFPRENIAEILVIDLRDGISTGIVIRGIKEARVGDRVEARKGL